METDDKPLILYTTWPGAESAAKAGEVLVEGHLAACVNILPGMTSIYSWQGRIERATEVVMFVKTRTSLAAAARAAILARHPYDTPAVLDIPVTGGAEKYLAWIMAETAGGTAR